MSDKANVLVVGSGGVGTMAAYNLESGGKASVTSVLRSNYPVVSQAGFKIDSLDHGKISAWKPTKLSNSVPDVLKEGVAPFDFIVVTTKNIPDVPPTVSEIIAPAVTKGHTVIALVQNGLNIEKPLIAAFPDNVILSGISLIGATEKPHGCILHDDHDTLIVGPFESPAVSPDVALAAAARFVDIYNASGKVTGELNTDVGFVRWRKLVYNACYNSICTILRIDTSRLQIAQHPIANLIRPAMWEVWHTAKAAGHQLPDDQVEKMIVADPFDTYFKPSMCQDIEKGNYIEFENIVGEPLREAERLGVPTPTLKVVYSLLKTLQWKTMEERGLISVPK